MSRSGIDPELVTRYLRRLGIGDPGAPSVAALRALHRAHVERIPYEVLEIQLGWPTTVEPRDTIDQILRGSGGYCVQLNGAFATLLAALGYRVTWHGAQVQASGKLPAPAGPSAPHLAPTVELAGARWFVDVGLGDGLHDPLPLRAGSYRQGPFTFQLGASRLLPGGWRFDHHPRGSIVGLDFRTDPAGPEEFAAWHPYLVTSPESRLVRTVVVMRRDATGADRLVGCMLSRLDATGTRTRELAGPDEWFGVLADRFGLSLAGVDRAARAGLWSRVHTAHQRWLAARADRPAGRESADA
jgi:arylamine N-acetyltransferase